MGKYISIAFIQLGIKTSH